jgi:hypothetical protein
MDIPLVLEKLGYIKPTGEPFYGGGGATSASTYAELEEDWPESNPTLSGEDVFNSAWIEVEIEQATVDYKEKRLISGYETIGNQLDILYWDIYSGKFGDEAKNSQWFSHCSGVKADYPKPL